MRKKHTTVILTEKAQEIKEDLAPVFGLKNILSAGLILVGRLSSDNQKSTIAEANGSEVKSMIESKADFRKRVCEVLDDVGVPHVKMTRPRQARPSKP